VITQKILNVSQADPKTTKAKPNPNQTSLKHPNANAHATTAARH